MAIKTFSTYAAYIAAKTAGTVTAADTVAVKDNALTPVQVAALGKDSLVDTIRVSPISLKVAQFTAAEAKLNAQDKITVSDTAAVINSNLATLLANAKVDSIAAAGGSIELTVAQTSILANMAKIPASPISVVDSSANIQSKLGVLFANPKITSINSNEDGVAITLTPAQAINPIYVAKLQKADTIVVTGSAAAIQTNLDALLSSAKIDSIISDGGALKLTVAQATAANLQKINGTSTLNVVDASSAINSAGNVKLVSLLANAKVDSINSTDDAAVPLKLNAAQAVAAIDAGTLVKIQSTDALTVVDSSANIQANLSKLLANAKIDSINSFTDLLAINLTAAQVTPANMLKLQLTDNIAVVDTGANIQAKLAALLANPKIDSIATSDASTLTLGAAAAVADSAAKISGNIAVSDTSAAINANLDALLADAKVTSINSTQDATAITLTATQALVAANLDKLQAADNVVVALTSADSALTSDQITALNALVGGKVDSIQNAFTFAATTDDLVAEGNGISFTVTSLIPVAADTTFTYSIQGNGANPTTASDLTPTSGTVKILAGASSANFTINAINEGTAEFDEGAIVSLKSGTTVVGTQAFTVTDGASYTLVADAASANEGSMATFTLNTVNVADDTVLTYTLSGTNIDASDIVGGSLTGTTTVTGGVATIDVQLVSDLKTEGAETLKVTVEGEEASAVINDTSLDATYTLVADQATANEGANATFTLTSNAPVGSVVDYTLSGVSAEDVTGGLLTGQATIGAGGTATITVPLVADQMTEGSETLTVTAGGQTATTAVNDSSLAAVLAADAVSGTIVNGQGTAIMNAATVASWLANDKDTTGLAAPTGAVTIDMNSAVGGQLIVLGSGDTMFVANAGVRQGSFEYSVAGITTTKGTVNVTLNTVPVIGSGTTLAATEDTVANGTITVTDGDNDALTYTFANGAHGTVVAGANGAYTYTPAANYNGTDTVTATISDGYTTITQDIAVTVASVNDDPQAITPAPAAVAVTSGNTATVDLAMYATDPDLAAGDTTGLTFALTSGTSAKGGTVTVSSGGIATITYPQGGGSAALGADSFGFTVKDAVSAAIPATVTLNVTNTAPTAGAIALTAKTGVTQTIDLLAGTSTQGSTVTTFTSGVSDADNNTLTPAVVVGSLSSGGSAEVTNGKIVYTSTVGFVGTETMKYTVSDGFGGTAEQTITFTVSANTGGTSGNDLLFGSTAAENIDGLTGDDTIVGGGGLDTITGGDGNDTVTFSDAAVQIQGGNGIDTLVVNSSSVAGIFDLSADSTTAAAVTGATLTANNQLADKNSTNSTTGRVVVLGFENLDASKASSIIVEDAGTTTSIITGTGADTVYLNNSTGTVTVTVGEGADTVTVGGAATGKYSVDGGAGNDSITGNTKNDTLVGGTGDDSITSGSGDDSISAGDGNDTVTMAGNLTSVDTVSGGSGTDTLSFSGTIVDSAFTNVSAIETLTLSGTSTLTLGSIAAATGVVTVNDTNIAAGDTITVGSGFTNNLTIGSLSTGQNDTISASAFTKNLTVTATEAFAASDTITAGAGTADSIVYTLGAGLTQGSVDFFSGIESIGVASGSTGTFSFTTNVSNVTGTNTLTIDSTNTSGVATISAAAQTAGKMIINTGSGNDVITGTGSTNGDSITAGAGNDTIAFASATLTSIDTVAGGSGTDVLTVTGTVIDSNFTNVSSVETITANAVLTSLTLGSSAAATGITTVNDFAAANDLITIGAGFTNDLTVAVTSGNDSVAASAYTKNLTVTMSAATDGNDSIAGGTGTADKIVYADAIDQSTGYNFFSGIERIAVASGSTGIFKFTTNASNVTGTNTLTIDSTNTTGVATINASATNAGALTITTGSAADLITVTGATLGDSISAGAGNDTITAASGNLTSLDTISGGSGTDIITSLGGALTDAVFTNVTSVETLNLTTATHAVTLGSAAAAAGVVSVTDGYTGAADSITIGSGFTSNLTVTMSPVNTGSSTIAASAYTKDLTVSLTSVATASTDTTVTGGTGTNDTIVYADGADQSTGYDWFSGIEKIAVAASSTGTFKFTTVANNVTGTNTLTIDSTNTSGIATINLSASNAGKLVVNTGAANDALTISGAATYGDSITAGAGNDTITVSTTANLTSLDTIAGGDGTDIITFTQAAGNAVTDAMFTKVTSVETVSLGTDTTSQSITLGTAAVAAGVTTVTAASVTTNSKIATIDLSGMVGSAGVSITGGSGGDIILGGTGKDTISGGATGANDIISGGAGADTIALDTAPADKEVVRINLNADVASGTTLANADTYTGFTTTKQAIDLSGTTLQSTGGTILALTSVAVTSSTPGAVGTENDTLTGSNDLGGTTAARFLSTGTASNLANLGSLANQPVLVFELTTDIVTGTTASVANTLLNQAGVDEAVSYITTNIGTATVANTNALLVVADGTNQALFQYQEGTLDQGIQASELTLVGVFNGNATLAAADFV